MYEYTNAHEETLSTYGDTETDTQSYDVTQCLVSREEETADISTGEYAETFTNLVDYAMSFLGNPYVWGGESLENGVDCSGFIKMVYAHYGISLPHSSYSLRNSGECVTDGRYEESLTQPGDIICYEGHVALYIGDGKIIHAANKHDGIKISNADYRSDIVCVRRIQMGHGIWGDVSDEEFDALCRIVEAEAGNESYQEKIYVTDVVLNRVCSSKFKETSIIGVITAPGQFQPVTNGRWQVANASKESVQAVTYALNHTDSSMGALYFMNPDLSDPKNVSWFSRELTYLFSTTHTSFFK
jgi:hypothetical protein